jgi:hypothetical protein
LPAEAKTVTAGQASITPCVVHKPVKRLVEGLTTAPVAPFYLPGDLEAQVSALVEHYNHARYHESLGNLTPADVYFGRGQTILLERERIKRQTIERRRLQHHAQAA